MNLDAILIPPSLDPKQATRLRRFGLAALTYALGEALATIAWLNGMLPASTVLDSAVVFITINLVIYTAIRSGFNLRFRDPSLTLFQMLAAITILMYIVYHMNSGRDFALFACFIIFLFGTFRLSTHEFILVTIYTLAAHSAVIFLLMYFRPQAVLDVTREWISWLTLAGFLPCFSIVGGRVNKLARRLHDSATQLRLFTDNVPAMTASYDENLRCRFVNKRFAEFFGLTVQNTLGMHLKDVVGEETYSEIKDHYVSVLKGHPVTYDRVHELPNGESRYLEVRLLPHIGDKGDVLGCYSVTADITERKKAEERINELAFYDQLTGLANRTLLLDRLRQTMRASDRNGIYGALLFIDLDHFKSLNDTRGHNVGDLLLKQVAQRLTSNVRAADTVSRLGGDEFVVMLASLSTDEKEAVSRAELVGGKILAVLGQIYPLEDVSYRCTSSIGATLFKGISTETDHLLKQADLAMYRSKDEGRNTIRFFDPIMETEVMQRVSLEKDLREALQDNQLFLHYQAQVKGERQLVGVEVLARWKHPLRGMVPPAEFIPLAEQTGLILPLGHWVLETACTQIALWSTRPEMAHISIAVNVSAHQFRQPDFVDQVLEVLRDTGANPQRLKLELTESLLVSNVEDIIEKMFALKARGVCFSLDDFGTGYSSLSYLKRLPLDQLKIDQSFVRDILSDPNDATIARTIIALAHSFGLDVIAEGVETAEQQNFLASSGCHSFQGYFFSRPLPLEGFEEFSLRGTHD